MHRRFRWIPLALALLLPSVLRAPSSALGQGLSVSPSCGTSETHFIISGGGLGACPKSCPDSCHVFYSVSIDGNAIFSTADCQSQTGFTIDLQNVPGTGCVACTLQVTTHTVKLEGGPEPSNYPPVPPRCVTTTFQVVTAATNGDPWGNQPMTLTSDGRWININFLGCATCDVPPCDSIVMVQTIRPRADDGLGHLTPYGYVQQHVVDGARYDSLLAADGRRIDVPLIAYSPYYLGTYLGTPLPIARPAIKDGHCQAASIMDRPNRTIDSFRPGVAAIVFEFEVNVFCAVGVGAGQWLGGCAWIWRRSLEGTTTITLGSCARSTPSSEFMTALEHWSSLRGFTRPAPTRPVSGGEACK